MPTTLPSAVSSTSAPTHDAARLYSRARRNLLPRDERLVAVAGRWQHEHLRRLGVEPEVTLRCGPAEQSPTRRRTRSPRRPSPASTPASPRRRCCRSCGCPTGARPRCCVRDARLVLVADGIEYAGNLGTLVRTADAAGADGLVLTNADLPADPPEGLRGQPRHGADAAGARRTTPSARPAATWPPPASRRTSPTRPPPTTYLDVDYAHQQGRDRRRLRG